MTIANIFFTDRQCQLLHLMRRNPAMTHAQLGVKLGIKGATVEAHLRLIYNRLGINKDKAVILALEDAGWFEQMPQTGDEIKGEHAHAQS